MEITIKSDILRIGQPGQMVMESPLIFTHFGYQSYLDYTLTMARKSNPSRRLIFLGDQHNRDLANRKGWEHYEFSSLDSALLVRFSEFYRPVYGPKRKEYYERNPGDKWWYLKWLRFVTERWFFIQAFVEKNNFTRIWHFDSDTMILQDLCSIEASLSTFDYTMQCGQLCLNGIATLQTITEYCEHICLLYEDEDYLAQQQKSFDDEFSDFAFTEMRAFGSFKTASPRRGIWLMDHNSGAMFDDCLCASHGFETVTLKSGQTVKNIFFTDGVAYGKRHGQTVPFATLNLSWLPPSVYRWVFAAKDIDIPTQIVSCEEPDMTVGIEFEHPRKMLLVQANNYDEKRNSYLAELREKFRFNKKTLVTFASGMQFQRQQLLLASAAIMTGEFDTVENWNFDRLTQTSFFKENEEVLKQSRGQGYWLWKPYIIMEALRTSKDGDLIVYTDCGPDTATTNHGSILPTMLWLSNDRRRFAASINQSPNSEWTKRDCFFLMNCDSPEYWTPFQVAATYFSFIASPVTRDLISDWLRYCCDSRVLDDSPNTCGLENFPDFREHRHDQSVLNNLLIKRSFTVPVVRFGAEVKSKSIQEMLYLFESKFLRSRIVKTENCISLGKQWRASSNSVWSPAEGVMDEDSENRDFFFHTAVEDAPWWILDLGGIFRVSEVVIINRPNLPHGMRARRIVVQGGIFEDNLDLLFNAATSAWDPYTPLSLTLPNPALRFVKISLDTIETLHLKDVLIYGSSCGSPGD